MEGDAQQGPLNDLQPYVGVGSKAQTDMDT